MNNLPTSHDILEELAEQVLVQMNKQAVTGFKTRLKELTDFHKFLLAASIIKENGEVYSFAQISDGWVSSPYTLWNREYFRLFEKAAEMIGVENDFISYLSRLPTMLMPQHYEDTTEEIVADLLNFYPYLVHRVENWVSNKRLKQPDEPGTGYSYLSGSDQKVYEDVLEHIISGWEDALMRVPYFYNWEKVRDAPSQIYWKHLIASWPYLSRHLKSSTHLVAASVWNDDLIGARDYVTTLLRWGSEIKAQFRDHYYLRSDDLISFNIVHDTWHDTAIEAVAYAYDGSSPQSISPSKVMGAIIMNAHKDAIVVTVGILIRWHIQGSLSGNLPLEITKDILDGNLSRENSYSESVAFDFAEFLISLVRIFGSSKQGEASYQGILSGWAYSLDLMSERRVIPGRVFSPSTIRDLSGLTKAWIICALERLAHDTSNAEGFKQRFGGIIDHENYFPDLDYSIRELRAYFVQMSQALTGFDSNVLNSTLRKFNPDIDLSVVERFGALLAWVLESIDQKRLSRIRERVVDPMKLESISDAVVTYFIKGENRTGIFANYSRSIVEELDDPIETYIKNYSKGSLTEPEMDRHFSLDEHIGYVSEYQNRALFRDLLNVSRTDILLESKELFWPKVFELSEHIENPILLVGRWMDYNERRGLQENSYGFQFNIDNHQGFNAYGYLGTIGRINILRFNYSALDQDRPKAFLLSSNILERIEYRFVRDRKIIDVSFEENGDDPWHGKVTYKFSPKFIFRNERIFEVSYPSSEVE